MKTPKFYIGIDTSKRTVDVALLAGCDIIAKEKVDNKEKSLTDLFRKFRISYGCTGQNSILCVEKMGIYNSFLCNTTLKKRLKLYQESPLRIKKSLGIQRGKNDALDAERIARYSSAHFNDLKLWHAPRPVIQKLKALSTIRARIVRIYTALTLNKKNECYYLGKKQLSELSKYTHNSARALASDLINIETEIDKTINSDERLRRLVEVITSVPCIGKIIATEMIICTNEFEASWTSQKFACYSRVAPFKWESGESIKGKTRVSFYGNKNIKSLLHMAAMGVLRLKSSFLKGYYDRKVEEGKNKMSMINALEKKLILRVFSCVRNDRLYREIINQAKRE